MERLSYWPLNLSALTCGLKRLKNNAFHRLKTKYSALKCGNILLIMAWISLSCGNLFFPTFLGGAEVPDSSIVATYRKAVAADPQDVHAHFNLGLALYQLEQYAEAQQVLEKCLSLNPADQAAHKQVDGTANQILGLIYFSQLGDDARAVTTLRRSLELIPEDAQIYYVLGLAEMRRKNFNEAQNAFQAGIQFGRQDAEIYFYLARTQVELQKEPEAIENYKKALSYKPDFKEALEDLALLYHRRQEDDHTIEILLKLVAIEPMHFNANSLLGFLYHKKKMYAEMVAAYNRAVAVKPDLADAHYNLGTAYYYQTRYDLAVSALSQAARLNPQDAEIYNLLGQAKQAAVDLHMQKGTTFLAQERYAEAILEFQKVLELDSANHKARTYLEDTERQLKEALASHLSLGEKFYQEGRLEDAYNEFEEALKFDPTSERAKTGLSQARVKISHLLQHCLRLGQNAEKLKDYKEAIRQYESALTLKPDYQPAQNALGSLKQKLQTMIEQMYRTGMQQLKQNALHKAVLTFERILKLTEIFPASAWEEKALAGLTQANARQAETIQQLLTQGKKAHKEGKTSQAKQLFNQVLELDAHNRIANEYIMKLTGQTSQAKVTAELVKSTYYRGVDYYVKGQVEKAIVEWEKVVALDPDNQDARINIERAKAKLAAIRKLTGE